MLNIFTIFIVRIKCDLFIHWQRLASIYLVWFTCAVRPVVNSPNDALLSKLFGFEKFPFENSLLKIPFSTFSELDFSALKL